MLAACRCFPLSMPLADVVEFEGGVIPRGGSLLRISGRAWCDLGCSARQFLVARCYLPPLLRVIAVKEQAPPVRQHRHGKPAEENMQARMTSITALVPDALKALIAFSASARNDGVPETTANLVHLRASQINGCSVCTEMHSREMKKAGESDERVFAVAAWRESPYFTDAERAALALTEAATRLADRPDPVPDEVWNEAARHYDERALACLIVEIATINAFNRLSVPTRQQAGRTY
jgi:AhpD family alkylhydroperoxidase